MNLETWWHAALAVTFVAIPFNRANTALFVMVLVTGLAAKTIW